MAFNNCLTARLLVAALLALCVLRAAAAPAPPVTVCSGPLYADSKAGRFCAALNTFLELYAQSTGEDTPLYQAIARDYPELMDTGMKRQDVIHSFLRFGRRR